MMSVIATILAISMAQSFITSISASKRGQHG